MVRLCWRCGAPHDEGTTVCPNCGAAFASSEDRYQTDGRTVSSHDDSAYLTSSAPRYKKNRTGLVIGIAVVLIAAVAIYAMIGSSGILDPDIAYDYKITDVDPYGETTVDIRIDNLSSDTYDWQGFYFEMEYKGYRYGMMDVFAHQDILPDWYYTHTIHFDLPSGATAKEMTLHLSYAYSDIDIERQDLL